MKDDRAELLFYFLNCIFFFILLQVIGGCGNVGGGGSSYLPPLDEVTITDTNGEFVLYETCPETGTITVHVVKEGGFDRREVGALDAVMAGRADLDTYQKIACDVNGDGACDATDGTLINQFSINKIKRFPVAEKCGSDWAFIPVYKNTQLAQLTPPVPGCPFDRVTLACTPGQEVTAVGVDFLGIVYGDITGNWSNHP